MSDADDDRTAKFGAEMEAECGRPVRGFAWDQVRERYVRLVREGDVGAAEQALRLFRLSFLASQAPLL